MSSFHRRSFIALMPAIIMPRWFPASGTPSARDFDLISPGIVTLGADASYPPHTFLDPASKKVVGLDVDLTAEIANRMGLGATFTTIEWGGIIPALQAKRFDLITCEMNITAERAKAVDFSNPVLSSGQVVVVREDTMDIHTTDDLKGRTVLVPLGTTEEQEARKHTKKVKTFATLAECFRELRLGRGDAIIVDLAVASYYAREDENLFKVATPPVNKTQSAYAFRKDEASSTLRLAFNETMSSMRRDGTYAAIIAKWILPSPPSGPASATPTTNIASNS